MNLWEKIIDFLNENDWMVIMSCIALAAVSLLAFQSKKQELVVKRYERVLTSALSREDSLIVHSDNLADLLRMSEQRRVSLISQLRWQLGIRCTPEDSAKYEADYADLFRLRL